MKSLDVSPDYILTIIFVILLIVCSITTTQAENANKDEAAMILAVETRSAQPIEDRVAISLAVISRQGIKFIQAGNQRIPVSADR